MCTSCPGFEPTAFAVFAKLWTRNGSKTTSLGITNLSLVDKLGADQWDNCKIYSMPRKDSKFSGVISLVLFKG
jgi:hypothetical protein